MPIELRGVGFSYRPGEPVLEGATLTLGDGEMVALSGPSGSGKSTLLQIIGDLLRPAQGSVIGRPPVHSIRWVFQTPTALGRRSALDNVLIGLHGLNLGPVDAHDRAQRALAAVSLTDRARSRASTLSGGELQRLQLARALAPTPPLVIADEPTAHLDHGAVQGVLAALRQVHTRQTSIIIATHDAEVAASCDRRLILRDGRIIEGPD